MAAPDGQQRPTSYAQAKLADRCSGRFPVALRQENFGLSDPLKDIIRREKMEDNFQPGCVGPYWFVRDDRGAVVLLSHLCPLDSAEKYGRFLTCPHGHYDVWESWRTGQSPEVSATAVIRDCEYEEWPRGRVVFDSIRSKFIVYADLQIFRQEIQQRVLERFHIIPEKAEFSRDEHYVSTCRLFDGGRRQDFR